MLLATLLRDPIPSSWDSSEASLGLPQALFMLAILVLALLLAGVMIWRVRRPSRTRLK
ncbi:MAG: hypothetical protein AVDCRST_MAG78-729 [uncultured Rubrobacteraceae bacterium]|uniref:Uncharacterized protein n=1 Tax=uncultured Rubrobacteraceae bacterium TaxID=349277 RepID=A0A6J4PIN4_9ACTN|nr:MAG: hypothetical protein AVDCRST_MAG78-729 [uncultured Rubrobacteraceae bacterium]